MGWTAGCRQLTGRGIDASVCPMPVRLRLAFLSLTVLLVCPSVTVLAQPAAQEERIAASFLLALGRTPSAAEIQLWSRQEPLSLADLVARHRRQLQDDPAAQRAVIIRAGEDAFGRVPGEDEVRGMAGAGTYADVMRRHLQSVADRPAEYERVLNRAYRLVLQRDAYSVEIDYWKRQPVLSFALLAACIEDWARRNQPGLMATTGVASVSINSAYLSTVRLSPAVAAEARAAAGSARPGDAASASALGRHVVAPGAEQVASVGGIHFAAAGSARLGPAL
jgi:hypothetical protein